MLDLDLLQSELIKRPEVMSVIRTADGLEVVVRSGINFYDEEFLEMFAASNPELSVIKDNIRNVQQEHKYVVTKEYCHRDHHHPVDAFCDPFLSMGCAEYIIRELICESKYREVADLMVLYTQYINVEDVVLMRYLYAYITAGEINK